MIVALFSVLFLILFGNYLLNSLTRAPQAALVQDSKIAEMISEIKESEIYEAVYSLQNFTSHRYRDLGNMDATTYLYNRLDNISGLAVEYQSSFYNIIATLSGDDATSSATYIVGAHYDSTSSNQSYAPGATDNGGGVGIVLEFARIMSQYRFNHTLIFALWNGEEDGQLGSNDYAKYVHDNKLNISLYVNFDSTCYDPHGRLILDLMYNDKSKWIADIMTQYNTLYDLDFTLTYNAHTCNSDHKPFWQYGYTAVMTHEEEHGPAHTQQDTVDKVSTIYAKKNGQLGMSILAKLAEVQETNQEAHEFTPFFTLPMLMLATSFAAIILTVKRPMKTDTLTFCQGHVSS